MIIFTNILRIPEYYLERKGIKRVYVYNLTSYYSDGVINLNSLIPSIDNIPEDVLNGSCDTADFDIAYHQYILNNNSAFVDFMSIMIPAYMEPDSLVQVLIEDSPYRNAISESLAKLIQQRYGYEIFYIYEPEYFLSIDDPDFMNVNGVQNIDQDVNRYREMMYGSGYYTEDEYAI